MRRTNHRLFRNREGLFISLAAVGGLIAQVQAVTSPATSPHSAVPFATLRMVLDGRVTEKEWRDAAVVRNICVFGTAQPANPATTFYLKHDGAALLVGVRCLEYGAGYPKAHPRKSTDQLSDDDAIQVVLGTAEECLIAREVLNMGGYAGAMKQPAASADHYYQFTVNAVGARARTYNESVLERPLFQAQASRLKDEWDVEMRIPFASAGILKAVDRTLLANFFRFRPPDMAGWHLPGFGGYVPMPFGTTTLLPRGQEEERTVEVKRVTPKPSAAPAGSEIPMEIQWYPLSRCVVGSLSCRGPAEGSKAVLRVVGFGEKQARLSSFRQSRVIYDLPTTAALPAKAELELRSKDGRLIRRVTRTLEQVPQPPWHGTKVGEAYLKDRIPSPWTRPEMRGRRVRLHDKTLTFGSSGLFESVRDDLGELLAGPAEILLVARGRQILLRTDSKQVSVEGTAVRVEARQTFPGGAVETRAMVDYDGFTVVKLRVRGVGPKLIQKLSLRIPLCKENAKFVHRELVQEIRELTGFGWEGPAGPVWLGGHDKGLSFNSDTDLFLSRKRRSQVQVIEEPDRTWLQMNLVDGAGQVTEPDHIFRFFLQPTPTKRLSLRKQQSFYDFAWEQWSDYQGYPDLAKTGILSKSAEAAHAKGRLFGIYTCQLLAENTPGFSTYRTDLLASPPRSMYQRAYDPGEGVPCYLCCKRG
ncbi:MAG: hypothetical protein HY318_17415, partial [Armatimonadetes bacterium]|nr:hypothetical protein [Armatimonadota bacterium]